MKISVIIPTYNNVKYIVNTIESMIAQTYHNFECIIIDDGSIDDSKQIVAPFLKDSRFIYHYQTNGGLSNARNKGLELATGDYIYFYDVDDLIPNYTIKNLYDLAIKNPNVDMVLGKSAFTNGQNNQITQDLTEDFQLLKVLKNENLSILKDTFEKETTRTSWNRLCKTSFLKEHQLKFKKGIVHEDELWFFETLYYAKNIIFSDQITYFYNKGNEGSITSNIKLKNIKSNLSIITEVFNKYFLVEKNQIKKDIIAIFIIMFKKKNIAHCYSKLSENDRILALPLIKNTFQETEVNSYDSNLLNDKNKRNCNLFLSVQHMNPDFIFEFVLLTRKVRYSPKKIFKIFKMKKEAKQHLLNP